MDIEIWKNIRGFDGYYQISSFGRVRSVDRWIVTITGRKILYKSKIRKLGYDKDGYARLSLTKNKCVTHFRVAFLVTENFIGDIPTGYVVAHKDGIRTNNKVGNLKVCTQLENIRDKITHGTMAFGSKTNNAKLKEYNIKEIRELIVSGIPILEIAKKYNVTRSAIDAIKYGKTWKQII